jgi:hypothetical protein
VALFGEKRPCPHCDRKVARPKDPTDYLCPHCHQPGPWATSDQAGAWRAMDDARASYRTRVEELVTTAALPESQDRSLAELRDAARFSDQELTKLNLEAFSRLVAAAVADDILTREENQHVNAVLGLLGNTWDQMGAAYPSLVEQAYVSSINGGILPEVTSPHILPKKGEVVYYECSAKLMKEVAVRQYQGGYQGFSIPIGKTGVRYRVGATKGHSVQVGTQLQVADSGLLSITNKRAVYTGTRKTVEMLYSKLVNLTAYSDGVQFHLSNRVNAPLFTMPSGANIVAAIVNSAAQNESN